MERWNFSFMEEYYTKTSLAEDVDFLSDKKNPISLEKCLWVVAKSLLVYRNPDMWKYVYSYEDMLLQYGKWANIFYFTDLMRFESWHG
jgi:hypothetical protein